MPVILHARDYDRWLSEYDEARPPIDLLRPYESEGMRMTPANRLVGNVRNNGPEILNSFPVDLLLKPFVRIAGLWATCHRHRPT
jgi:putative SOS response-associated peptidase YedK